nr:formate/nitrite transporter family protein [Trueperella bernardiae]
MSHTRWGPPPRGWGAGFFGGPAGRGAGAGHPSATGTLTVQSFLLDNLIPVTLGNIVGGGLMIGMFFWWTHAKAGATSASRR